MDFVQMDAIAEITASYIRRDGMINALESIHSYCKGQMIDEHDIKQLKLTINYLRDAIFDACEVEVALYRDGK